MQLLSCQLSMYIVYVKWTVLIRTRCPTHTTIVYNSKKRYMITQMMGRDFQSTVSLITHKTHLAWSEKMQQKETKMKNYSSIDHQLC